jgi:hypothetical protein
VSERLRMAQLEALAERWLAPGGTLLAEYDEPG